MNMRKTIIAVISALALVGSVAVAANSTPVKASTNAPVVVSSGLSTPAPTLRGWEVTAGASVATGANSFSDNAFWGGELGIGKQVNLKLDTIVVPTVLGIRQGASYGTVESYNTTIESPCVGESETKNVQNNGWVFRTEAFWDWNFPVAKKVTLFVGPTAGAYYGNITPNWTIGPEAGVKYAFNDQWFTFARANYDISLNESENVFRGTFGVGFNF